MRLRQEGEREALGPPLTSAPRKYPFGCMACDGPYESQRDLYDVASSFRSIRGIGLAALFSRREVPFTEMPTLQLDSFDDSLDRLL